MLLLKLLLVPSFLLTLTLVGQRLGPAVAGGLAGLPVIAGPVLFVLAVENGEQFAASAAAASAAAVLALASFALTFTHSCRRLGLPLALLLALLAWFFTAWLLTRAPPSPILSLCIGATTVMVAPRLFPTTAAPSTGTWQVSRWDLALRMAAGVTLTLLVTLGADALGPAWAGVLSAAPVLSLVLAVFSYRKAGAAFTITLLRAMAGGLASLTVFCGTLAFALPQLGIAAGFVLALLLCIAAQRVTQLWILRGTVATGRG